MFVEYYLPAHPGNGVAAVWQTPTIPNRPHLKDERIAVRRYDILPADAVESVHLVVPDLGRANFYWAVVHSDKCLWHEKYDLAGDQEEGNYDKLNPDAFTTEGKQHFWQKKHPKLHVHFCRRSSVFSDPTQLQSRHACRRLVRERGGGRRGPTRVCGRHCTASRTPHEPSLNSR